jgi:hypothetical protein
MFKEHRTGKLRSINSLPFRKACRAAESADAAATTFADGSIQVIGGVLVTAGGKGHVRATLDFDSNGDLKDVSEVRRVRPGVRPICQATKLLDPDPLVRRMAEQDILVMGTAAKGTWTSSGPRPTPSCRRPSTASGSASWTRSGSRPGQRPARSFTPTPSRVGCRIHRKLPWR